MQTYYLIKAVILVNLSLLIFKILLISRPWPSNSDRDSGKASSVLMNEESSLRPINGHVISSSAPACHEQFRASASASQSAFTDSCEYLSSPLSSPSQYPVLFPESHSPTPVATSSTVAISTQSSAETSAPLVSCLSCRCSDAKVANAAPGLPASTDIGVAQVQPNSPEIKASTIVRRVSSASNPSKCTNHEQVSRLRSENHHQRSPSNVSITSLQQQRLEHLNGERRAFDSGCQCVSRAITAVLSQRKPCSATCSHFPGVVLPQQLPSVAISRNLTNSPATCLGTAHLVVHSHRSSSLIASHGEAEQSKLNQSDIVLPPGLVDPNFERLSLISGLYSTLLENYMFTMQRYNEDRANFTCHCEAPRLQGEFKFIQALVAIGRKLAKFRSKEEKTQGLISELRQLNSSLPARVWLPTAGATHLVLRIPPQCATVLNSKERAPFLIYVETLDCDEPLSCPLPPRLPDGASASETASLRPATEADGGAETPSSDAGARPNGHMPHTLSAAILATERCLPLPLGRLSASCLNQNAIAPSLLPSAQSTNCGSATTESARLRDRISESIDPNELSVGHVIDENLAQTLADSLNLSSCSQPSDSTLIHSVRHHVFVIISY